MGYFPIKFDKQIKGYYEMKNIIEDATIIYKTGFKEIYDAIYIIDSGVYTGEIKSIDKNIEFIQKKFIPKDQIEKIVFLNKNRKLKNIYFENNREEYVK